MSPVSPTTRRHEWMDALRGFAVLLIVVFHSTTLLRYAGVSPPSALASVNLALAPFRIPLLVFLSGLLVSPSLAKGSRTYLAGKARNVLYPYLVWLAVLAVVQRSVSSWTFLIGGSYLWFLAFLVVFYAAAWALRGVPTTAVVLVSLVASALAPDGGKYSERLLFLFALFMLGKAAHGWSRWDRMSSSAATAAVGSVVLMAMTAVSDDRSYGPLTLVQTGAGVLLAIVLARRSTGWRWLAPIRFAGRNSLVFYVAHFPVIYVAAHLAKQLPDVEPVLLVLLFAAIAIAVSTALAHLRGVGPFRFLFSPPQGHGSVLRST